MAGLLYIVSTERPDLYEHLRRSFADMADNVRIVVDRRFGERRTRQASSAEERRHSDRRQQDISRALDGLGWAVVRTCIEQAVPGLNEATGKDRTAERVS